MNRELVNRLLIIASVGLLLAALIFLCLPLFGVTSDTEEHIAAMTCILLANLFNFIRKQGNDKK